MQRKTGERRSGRMRETCSEKILKMTNGQLLQKSAQGLENSCDRLILTISHFCV